MSFGDRLKTALEMAGETRDSLAAELGVSVQAISQVINGKTKAMTAENCAKAARFLRVDLYWLATGSGEPRSVEAGMRLSDEERDLVLAFRDIPEKDQKEVLAAVMTKAEETRQVVLKALEKWGVRGFVPPEKAAKHLPPPPSSPYTYTGPERRHTDIPVEFDRRGVVAPSGGGVHADGNTGGRPKQQRKK